MADRIMVCSNIAELLARIPAVGIIGARKVERTTVDTSMRHATPFLVSPYATINSRTGIEHPLPGLHLPVEFKSGLLCLRGDLGKDVNGEAEGLRNQTGHRGTSGALRMFSREAF